MSAWLQRALNFRRGELRLGLLAALAYFCVLGGYGFLRPVREAMGVSRGMGELRWLFAGTSIASLAFVLAFGGAIGRLDRRRVVPLAYGVVIVCLGGFAGLLLVNGLVGGGLVGSDSETTVSRLVGYTFYIWLSVINLFVNSILWAFMADVFDVEQGKRIFPFIGIGGTLGALVGSTVTGALGGLSESYLLPVGLMLTGALLFGGAIAVLTWLDRCAVQRQAAGRGETASSPEVGGTTWDGLRDLVRSPYLLGIGAFIVLMAVSNTLIYFAQAEAVLERTDTMSQRVSGFAWFDSLAQAFTLLTQMFVTTRLIRRLGVGWTLAILPLVTLLGFGVLALWPLYGVMMVFQALHRATRYAVARPARETLFSVVPLGQKFRAKQVIDVFVYRGGDLAGSGISAALAGLGWGLVGLALTTLPLAGVWGALSLGLGRAQTRRIEERQSEPRA